MCRLSEAKSRSIGDEIGFALERAQWGQTHRKAKPLHGFSGVYEIVNDYVGDTY